MSRGLEPFPIRISCTIDQESLYRYEEEVRKQQRGLKQAGRELEKDRRSLEKQEKQLVRTHCAPRSLHLSVLV